MANTTNTSVCQIFSELVSRLDICGISSIPTEMDLMQPLLDREVKERKALQAEGTARAKAWSTGVAYAESNV